MSIFSKWSIQHCNEVFCTQSIHFEPEIIHLPLNKQWKILTNPPKKKKKKIRIHNSNYSIFTVSKKHSSLADIEKQSLATWPYLSCLVSSHFLLFVFISSLYFAQFYHRKHFFADFRNLYRCFFLQNEQHHLLSN